MKRNFAFLGNFTLCIPDKKCAVKCPLRFLGKGQCIAPATPLICGVDFIISQGFNRNGIPLLYPVFILLLRHFCPSGNRIILRIRIQTKSTVYFQSAFQAGKIVIVINGFLKNNGAIFGPVFISNRYRIISILFDELHQSV